MRVQTGSIRWSDYFEHNLTHRMPIDWESPYRLSADERRAILHSLQQFQLGESSEGSHLIDGARRYVEASGDTDYLPAIRAFIREEQQHAADLERFMQQQGLPTVESHWVDGVFRFLRRFMGTLEVSVTVLLTAEIIACAYYKALHDATQSPTLRGICRQILHDEIQHLRFQAETLDKLRRQRHGVRLWLTDGLQRLLFAGTLVIVWFGHRPVFEAAGWSARKYWRVNWRRYRALF